MLQKQKKIRILFNDSHVSMPNTKRVAQGGPARFSQLFTHYFLQSGKFHLTSLFFSHHESDNVIHRKITSRKNHDFFEILYSAQKINSTYQENYSKKEYLKYLEPWAREVKFVLKQVQPNIIFLNDYGLTNYILFSVARELGIPVCIQHAGIWKKEIMIGSGSAFSSQMKKLFSSFEKEVSKHTTHHIFLNHFSKEVFLKIHNLHEKDLFASSIVPLPVSLPKKEYPFSKEMKKQNNVILSGTVARWDAIKNHSALLRLGEYVQKNKMPLAISVVTQRFNGVVSKFREQYVRLIEIINPMSSLELLKFYRTRSFTILPSLFDVSPTVLMESISQGVPVIISSQTGWITEYKKFKLEKLIIDPSDSGAKIYKTILDLEKNYEEYSRKFVKLQQEILKKHNPEKVFQQYEKIFIHLTK